MLHLPYPISLLTNHSKLGLIHQIKVEFINTTLNLENPSKISNRYLEILLESELNSENRYQTFRDKEDKTKKTLLHYAAEFGFLHVTKTLVKKCPLLLGLKTVEQLEPEQRAMLPVESAILAMNDEVAAYLIRIMWHDRYAGS